MNVIVCGLLGDEPLGFISYNIPSLFVFFEEFPSITVMS